MRLVGLFLGKNTSALHRKRKKEKENKSTVRVTEVNQSVSTHEAVATTDSLKSLEVKLSTSAFYALKVQALKVSRLEHMNTFLVKRGRLAKSLC